MLIRRRPLPLLLALGAACGTGPTEGVGPPADLLVVTAPPATGFVGNYLPGPVVRVTDDGGRPVAGVSVRFAVAIGQVYGSDQVTASDGTASPDAWRLGATAGAQVLTAAVDGLEARATVTAVMPPAPGGFRFQVVHSGEIPPSSELDRVRAAVARWEAAIVGDLPDATVGAVNPACPQMLLFPGAAVDDLLLFIHWEALVLGTVARTVVCQSRGNGGLPSIARIVIDRNGANVSAGVEEAILHEIGHALGIGTVWEPRLRERSSDLRFTGPAATAAWRALGGPADTSRASGVPVEMAGSQAVARAHWRESLLDTELMTPFAETLGGVRVPQILSAITLGALRDLGYLVDDRTASPFPVP